MIADHLGATRALADASGSITASISYDAYGNVANGSASTRYTYTGREADDETGLIYYRARWYDPRQGRFISEDPIGLQGGVNLFNYVANNPLSFTDPSGLCSENTTQPQDDCHRFADMVAEIAGRHNTTEGFMDEMARTFTAANNSSRAEMRANIENALPPDRIQIGDAGFRAEYRDGTNLQVRHFVGGLLYGYRYGSGGPMLAGAVSEALQPAPTGNMADVRLNSWSMSWGNNLEPRPATVTFSDAGRIYRVPAYPGYRGLADLIRAHICE